MSIRWKYLYDISEPITGNTDCSKVTQTWPNAHGYFQNKVTSLPNNNGSVFLELKYMNGS